MSDEMNADVAEFVMGCCGRTTVYAWADRKKRERPIVAFTSAPVSKGQWDHYAHHSFNTWSDAHGKKVTTDVYLPLNASADISAAWHIVEHCREIRRAESALKQVLSLAHCYTSQQVAEAICKAALSEMKL